MSFASSATIKNDNTIVPGRYDSFQELAFYERESLDYSIEVSYRPYSKILIMAPHGGTIEPGTSEIARLTAGMEMSLYCFEGKKDSSCRALHITSRKFDEPQALDILKKVDLVVTIHGCNCHEEAIFLGGRHEGMKKLIAKSLSLAGYECQLDNHKWPGVHQKNVCNGGQLGMGVQLEISNPFRSSDHWHGLALALRRVL